MSDEIKAQVEMLHRDVSELRSVDLRLTTLIEDHGRALESMAEAFPRVTGDLEYLKKQHSGLLEQTMEHGKMLLEHAKLHTQHAEALAATRDQARRATQSSSDLSREWRDAAQAIDRHVASVVGAHGETIKKTNVQVQRLATAQEQMNEQREADRKEQQLQTVALNQLVSAVSSKRFAAYLAAGAFAGGLIVAIVQKVFL